MRNSEIFRFLVARPVQRSPESDGLIRVQAPFVETLDDEPAQRRKAADTFLHGADFVHTLGDLATPLAELDRWLLANPTPTRAALDDTITRIFGMDPGHLVASQEFGQDANALRDSLAAGVLATKAPPGDRIVRGLRLVALIERLANDPSGLTLPTEIAAAVRAKVLVPRLGPAAPPTADPLAVGTRSSTRASPFSALRRLFGRAMRPAGAGVAALVGAGIAGSGVPTTAGTVRPSGVGDLQLVRQTLKRYDLGEISHVENVLDGEQHERTFRRSRTDETFTLIEREQDETSERDLQSTERFELQSQAKETINDSLSLQTGFQLSASYGPTVSVGVTAAGAYDRASEQSDETSTGYAREVVEQASSRLTDRTLERRETRTSEQTEDFTKHAVDNSKDSSGHVVGVYRWLDKIYEAQVVNYGKRTLFEFVVPEPAAFYRHVEGDQVSRGALDPPIPPSLGSGEDPPPLSPAELNEDTYTDLAARYGAEGVEPPPSKLIVGGITLERPAASGDRSRTTKTMELQVPSGYAAVRADVTYSLGGGDTRDFQLLVGAHFFSRGDSQEFDLGGERQTIPIALITRDTEALVATVVVDFDRTPEHFAAWQFDTFAAIMAGYQKQKLNYDAAAAAAQVQAGTQMGGRNPAANQEIIHSELKKAALSLLTAQHFDAFDAVQQEPGEYPQFDVDEALLEGGYIQFFEQAFEWQNLTYVFYPYFWGRKHEWPTVSLRDDVDPLFGQFLRAGAARVQAPLRPGFEAVIAYFLEFGQPWNGVDPPLVDDELYVALVEEVRGQTGASYVDGPGSVSVTRGSTTLTGIGTKFTTESDIDREIRIGETVGVIASVEAETSITLKTPHPDPTTENTRYSLGPRLVGQPWEVRVPTTLVMLQPDATLPSFDG